MKVITIDREFGAGGHTIGREVAERLGIEFYDRDIIAKAAAAGGLDPAHVEAEEETISKTHAFISAISPNSYDAKDAIFAHERAVVVELAAQGPCVILGRCANAILREEGVQVLKRLPLRRPGASHGQRGQNPGNRRRPGHPPRHPQEGHSPQGLLPCLYRGGMGQRPRVHDVAGHRGPRRPSLRGRRICDAAQAS